MSDPNMKDFGKRVARIKDSHHKGYGFEAQGTLGRSYYFRRPSKRVSLVLPIIFVVVAAFGLKAAIYQNAGAAVYQSRIDELNAGSALDKIGGWLLQADPVTVYLSEKIAFGLSKLKT